MATEHEKDNEQIKEKTKAFLTAKIVECECIIRKKKKRRMLTNAIYTTLIITSIIGTTTIIILSSLTLSPLIISIVSGISTASTAVSMKFGLENKKDKLACAIQKLNRIKDKLDYVINCNGDLTEEQCENILKEFREL